eukprot:CAMPEP_0196785336 /NCGR_PEP_ID=MMETSP1104-20130614/19136_1 /TAXON_ID=33652 /ORGANISM="Cafeteria sp., Strain Caron Lab Isolate" /LENGTH=30 /DNA_ID= /DNA_START= /DNA_END= /DNA_ORIENTATION=
MSPRWSRSRMAAATSPATGALRLRVELNAD